LSARLAKFAKIFVLPETFRNSNMKFYVGTTYSKNVSDPAKISAVSNFFPKSVQHLHDLEKSRFRQSKKAVLLMFTSMGLFLTYTGN
jgi:hypothetical protein